MVHIKGLISGSRIILTLVPGLGALILLRMAIHIYRSDIEDLKHRVPDCPMEAMYECYDFIVVGAGSAGAVVASRLSENPDWSVLLLEAGSDEHVLADVPVIFPVSQTSSIDWQFTTEPDPGYCLSMIDGKCKWPRGKVLGGSSAINAMLYVRGNRKDYDNWAAQGNPGWSYEEVLPYFKKSEDMRIPEYVNDSYHGKDGYMTIEYFRYEHPLTTTLLKAGEELGYKIRDINGEYQTGFTSSHATARNGLRCSTAKAFLRPAAARPNLHVSVNSHVKKILINDHKRAYGVLFEKGGKDHIVKASKEVILSAGSIQSPQLLMLSGVGDANHLKEVGIYPIHDLPGVGQNLQDHIAMGGHSFLFDNPYKNGSDYSFNIKDVVSLKSVVDFALNHKGPLYSLPECEAMGFVNTKYADPNDDYPDIQLYLSPAADNMDGGLFGKRANGLDDDTYAALYEEILFQPSFSVVPLLLRPKSRGYIQLKDDNPHSYPLIYPNYYTDPQDVKVMVEGARIAYELSQMAAMRELNVRANPRRNPGCEHHELMSDAHLECQARHHTLTIYHPVGTCAMAPEHRPGAVVSHTLKVHGIEHLRVVDASIMPVIINGNTHAPTVMIAEKASDMISEEWSMEPYREDDYCAKDIYQPHVEHNPNIRIDGKDIGEQSKDSERQDNGPIRINIDPNESADSIVKETCLAYPNLVPGFGQVQPMYNNYPLTTREYETKYKETTNLATYPGVQPYGYPQQPYPFLPSFELHMSPLASPAFGSHMPHSALQRFVPPQAYTFGYQNMPMSYQHNGAPINAFAQGIPQHFVPMKDQHSLDSIPNAVVFDQESQNLHSQNLPLQGYQHAMTPFQHPAHQQSFQNYPPPVPYVSGLPHQGYQQPTQKNIHITFSPDSLPQATSLQPEADPQQLEGVDYERNNDPADTEHAEPNNCQAWLHYDGRTYHIVL